MGKLFKKTKKTATPAAPAPPELALRRQNRKSSSFKMGRTISEKRERLETANERAAARKKDKKRKFTRIASTVLGFAVFAIILVCLFFYFFGSGEPQPLSDPTPTIVTKQPTIEIIDESGTGAKLPARTESYIALAERDFRDAGLTPIKAIIPSGAIREVDFYVEGHPGFIKMTTDRDSAVSVEDVARLYRYLESIGVKDFTYIDVRIAGQAYYK